MKPQPKLKELRGKLRRLELIQTPTEAQLKEIKWVKQCIEKAESLTEK